jgi:iron complex transport system substrate-binding protein
VLLVACAPAPEPAAGPEAGPVAEASATAVASAPRGARRIVSLDFCADQYVLKLADPASILALSPDAVAGFSYMRAAARGLPTVRPRAEDVLVLRPDRVVRSYAGGAGAAALFRRAGVPVVEVAFANTLEEVREALRRVSRGLGVPRRGEAVIAEMDARLATIRARPPGTSALYLTPSGVTAGPETLVDAVLRRAGLENFQSAPGWRPLPLERLAYERPDVVAHAIFGGRVAHDRGRTPARHPVARRQLREVPVVPLDGATTSCGAWYLVDAVEALSAARGAAGATGG